jgi:hypothetical protein
MHILQDDFSFLVRETDCSCDSSLVSGNKPARFRASTSNAVAVVREYARADQRERIRGGSECTRSTWPHHQGAQVVHRDVPRELPGAGYKSRVMICHCRKLGFLHKPPPRIHCTQTSLHFAELLSCYMVAVRFFRVDWDYVRPLTSIPGVDEGPVPACRCSCIMLMI